jgi:hypothetical protein
MVFDKFGTLKVNTYTAGGALPIPKAVIKIIGNSEENGYVEYSVITDIDGVTDIINLPAPSREYSQSPGSPEQSYALYDIEITAPGYYTKKLYDIAVFEGTESIQPVNMIPLPIRDSGVTYPRNNLTAVSRENINLE